MQRIATTIFIYASVAFGIIGIALVLSSPKEGDNAPINVILIKLLFVTVFVILPSFALSIAGKYLRGNR